MARTRSKPPIVIDSETKGIERRPEYPPKPVGVSIAYPGKAPVYFHFGHPDSGETRNSKSVILCEEWQISERLKDIARSSDDVLFFNGNFDVDVFETHLGMPKIPWNRVQDAMFLAFLHDPHARDLGLKPFSEKVLNIPPEERDAVKEWVLSHKAQIERDHGRFTPKEWGKFIWLAPAALVGPYANGDVTRTRDLYNYLLPLITEAGMLDAYNRERELVPIMLENERQGVRLDMGRLESDLRAYRSAMEITDNWLRKRLKSPGLDFEKDRQVADVLERTGIVTDWVLTPSGQKSVAKDNLTPSMFHDQKVARALGYRNRLKTCVDTFMENWLRMGGANGGNLHTHWNQTRNSENGGGGARTGRMSCSPNLMNIPTEWYDKNDGYVHPSHLKVPELPLVRSYVLGDKGQIFGGRDYNQQELRILGHFEDDDLMRAYQDNPELDTHSFVQKVVSELLRRDIPRKTIKEINFGTIYGQGMGSLAEKLGETVDTIKLIKNAQMSALPGLKNLDKGIKRGASDGIPIRTWGGRIYYKEESRVINGRTVDFSYKLLNYLIQGSAADCTKQALINYSKIKKNGRLLAQVHDEINISAPAKAMKAELLLLREAMADVAFDVPMLSEPYSGPNWAEVAKYKEAA